MPVRTLCPPMSPRSPFAQEATNHPQAAVAAPARATDLGPNLKIRLENTWGKEAMGYYWRVVINETKADMGSSSGLLRGYLKMLRRMCWLSIFTSVWSLAKLVTWSAYN